MFLTPEQMQDIGERVFLKLGVPKETASRVVQALVLAEMDGLSSHGLSRIPYYAAQAARDKVNRKAVPHIVASKPASVLVDADYGFAYPAMDLAVNTAMEKAKELGTAFFAVTHSHHCGVLGHYGETMARQGFVSLVFANAPASMAPWQGNKATFGTNPIAFGCPRPNADPLIMDMSLSKVARGKLMTARMRGEKIPEGWALDKEGRPTTDPNAGMEGTMVPMGDAKGAVLAFMVEILAAALPGANLAYQASSLFDDQGPAPNIGQSGIVIDPIALNPGFLDTVEALCTTVSSQENTRLPGQRRFALRAKNSAGVEVPDKLYEDLVRRAF